MNRQIAVRPAHATADDDEIARIISAVHPDWPRTGAEIAAAARRRGERFHLKFVAESAPGQLAGYGFLEVPDVAAAEGRLRMRVTVDPARVGHGIGALLYDALESEARQRGAVELCTEVLVSDPRAERFTLERGFVVYNRRIESRLALSAVVPERHRPRYRLAHRPAVSAPAYASPPTGSSRSPSQPHRGTCMT